ncbi:diacylglycerol/lipid kinase family protein [Metabacillus herbersteinensis]|uniref:Diacylglycerol/lipid kinase family protein n=1 Tax=Metabacillus herbersteinensis TaxID=283816 RepID=A0ABV6G887_9BACI
MKVIAFSYNIDDSEKAMLGKVSYFLSAFRTMQKMEPFSFKLTIDGTVIQDKAVMILVGNGRYIATNELPYEKSSLQDGLAEIYLIKNTNISLLKDVLTLTTSNSDENLSSQLQLFQGKKIMIETDESMDIDLDGEVYLSTPSTIEMLPGHFEVLVP